MAVAVVLAVGIVVAEVEADQVAQGEAVVRDHIVDRFARPPPRCLQPLRRAGQRLGELPAGDAAAQPEGAHGVAEAVVPFQPAARKVARLVAAGPQVPGLGDQLAGGQQRRQHRVLRHGLEERALALEAATIPNPATPQHRRQVEAEAVDMHLRHPEAQAVEHQAQHRALAHVHGVAAAAVVVIARTVIGRQAVAAGVVQPAPAEGGAQGVGFGRVVEHHVQQHLDAGGMQGAHHLAELGAGVGRVGRQARRGAEEAQGVVAPVVAQAHGHQALFVQPLVHRQQAHRGDAQVLQMAQHGGLGQAGVGAAQGGRHAGVQGGAALDMQLAQHGVGQRRARRPVVAPVEAVVHHAGLQRGGGVVARVRLQRVVAIVAEVLGAPVELADDLAGIRVEQQLGMVEAVAAVGPPGAVGAQAIQLAGPPQWAAGLGAQVAMPDVLRVAGQGGAVGLLAAAGVEQAQRDALGAAAVHGDVQAVAVPVRTQWPGLAGFQDQGRGVQAVHS